MTLLESIAQTIRDWPTLYGCRTDVLHDYFCKPDNSLRWSGGALVDSYGGPTDAERDLMFQNEEEELAFVALHDTALLARTRAAVRRRNMETRFRIDNADSLAFVAWGQGPLGVPPPPVLARLSALSAMSTVPPDVQPDWLAGVRETILAVFEHGWVPPSGHVGAPSDCGCAKRAWRAHNIGWAAGVLDRLGQWFGVPKGFPADFASWEAHRAGGRRPPALPSRMNLAAPDDPS